ncbi:MAG: N-formylglutamate amidohydrolase [Acidobacteriota bacterium]|nr:N-formylglutamate amidohydrolase [Acidobacteriota bacterium]MDH3529514.1 N-formylglutamate amidohydrolase [Acidobacteriota bacterium]
MDDPYFIIEPAREHVPFVLSIPHNGVGFPDGIKDQFVPELAAAPDDTDWFMDRLYDFAPSLGVTTICPIYSRWVIDLNREPQSKPLYDDGRIITALCPTTNFDGEPIYKDERQLVGDDEVLRRLDSYFWPYHNKIDEICKHMLDSFGIVIFWDGHSIRRNVPTIQDRPFPDFILGDNDGKTADESLIEIALQALNSSGYDVAHNRPFKGGFLTRSKGRPDAGVHALQLEMSKDLYMSGGEKVYSDQKAAPIKEHLKHVFKALIGRL